MLDVHSPPHRTSKRTSSAHLGFHPCIGRRSFSSITGSGITTKPIANCLLRHSQQRPNRLLCPLLRIGPTHQKKSFDALCKCGNLLCIVERCNAPTPLPSLLQTLSAAARPLACWVCSHSHWHGGQPLDAAHASQGTARLAGESSTRLKTFAPGWRRTRPRRTAQKRANHTDLENNKPHGLARALLRDFLHGSTRQTSEQPARGSKTAPTGFWGCRGQWPGSARSDG